MITKYTHFRRFRIIKYKNVAEAAARSERNGLYAQAAKLWLRAASMALNQVNRMWAENRSDFCLRKSLSDLSEKSAPQ